MNTSSDMWLVSCASDKPALTHCAGNQLTTLPAEIGSLQDLKYLNVMGNSLRNLPTEIGQLTKLSR